MMQYCRTFLFASFLAVISWPVMAADCGGVSMPDTVTVGEQTLALNGMGLRKATLLKVKVYVAGLYLANQSGDGSAIITNDQPRHLVLHFVRDVSTADITKAWREGFEQNAGDQLANLESRIGTLEGYMIDFKKDNTLTFSYMPGTGTDVLVNNDSKGVIEGADFGSALITIWLGDPPNKEIKEGLLGGECS